MESLQTELLAHKKTMSFFVWLGKKKLFLSVAKNFSERHRPIGECVRGASQKRVRPASQAGPPPGPYVPRRPMLMMSLKVASMQ